MFHVVSAAAVDTAVAVVLAAVSDFKVPAVAGISDVVGALFCSYFFHHFWRTC